MSPGRMRRCKADSEPDLPGQSSDGVLQGIELIHEHQVVVELCPLGRALRGVGVGPEVVRLVSRISVHPVLAQIHGLNQDCLRVCSFRCRSELE